MRVCPDNWYKLLAPAELIHPPVYQMSQFNTSTIPQYKRTNNWHCSNLNTNYAGWRKKKKKSHSQKVAYCMIPPNNILKIRKWQKWKLNWGFHWKVDEGLRAWGKLDRKVQSERFLLCWKCCVSWLYHVNILVVIILYYSCVCIIVLHDVIIWGKVDKGYTCSVCIIYCN